jgi:hypothetical protein
MGADQLNALRLIKMKTCDKFNLQVYIQTTNWYGESSPKSHKTLKWHLPKLLIFRPYSTINKKATPKMGWLYVMISKNQFKIFSMA